ncbi:MAG: T9SS type A sorting domain-containing protein [Ignavibacteriae bacterium]|nr:T9SS type A sorting domain-containing protein [Ignavibacteriota bacterium]
MKNSKLILLLLFSIYKLNLAQLSIDAFTNKDNYEYGEQIELYCKITNNSDSTFEFFAGNYETCQAEFSFNDFNSWEHTSCLSTNELLTFKPHSSKIYKWKIEPQSLGLPNKDGYQTIICNYFFDLKDTVIINAPKFIGGEIILSYDRNKYDIVNNISNSLNADIVFGSDYGDTIHEVWQIEGFDIDSLVQIYSEDSIFVSFEKSLGIAYDKIYDENLFDYYPLQIGNKWQYETFVDFLDGSYENYLKTVEIIADTILGNGKKYYIFEETSTTSADKDYTFRRIDSVQYKVYEYFPYIFENIPWITCQDSERVIFDLAIGDTTNWTDCSQEAIFSIKHSNSEFQVGTLNISRKKIEYLGEYWIFNKTISEGFGLTFTSYGEQLSASEILIYAKINNIEYGKIVGINNLKQTSPTNFSLAQNYPNPFNPTTTIEYSIPYNSVISNLQRDERSQNSNSLEISPFSRNDNNNLSLIVYDVLGREVATLVNQKQKTGNYKIKFNGSYLPSGVYYYQLKTNNFTQSKKMIILK